VAAARRPPILGCRAGKLGDKDEMFRYTDVKHASWWVVEADDKRRARLNCVAHLLSMIAYDDLTPPPLELPPRGRGKYVRPPFEEQTFVPQIY